MGAGRVTASGDPVAPGNRRPYGGELTKKLQGLKMWDLMAKLVEKVPARLVAILFSIAIGTTATWSLALAGIGALY